MCCNNTSNAHCFTCHMSLNPPLLKQDAGTNLVQTHSPGLGHNNFCGARGEFNFHLQNKSTAWRLLALRISLFHLHHTACECMLRVFQFFRCCLFSWNDGLMIDGNTSVFGPFGFEKCHHSWQLIRARPCSNMFKPTASALGSVSRSKACKRHERASATSPSVANCCKLQVKTITKPTKSVVVAICINASMPTFFLRHWQWWNSTRCSTQILLPTLTHNVDWCWH